MEILRKFPSVPLPHICRSAGIKYANLSRHISQHIRK